jgi:hypothetical protein
MAIFSGVNAKVRRRMKMRNSVLAVLCCAALFSTVWWLQRSAGVLAGNAPDWPEWGRTPQHTGSTSAVGQNASAQLANIVYDPFVSQEQADSDGELLVHYQVPLVDGNGVVLEVKTGSYTGPQTWNTQIWNERGYTWQNGSLTQKWNFQSDWKPEPDGGQAGLNGWEPVFHAALGGGFVYVPGFSGSVYKLKESDGTLVQQYAPFGTTDANTYVSGPLTLDSQGNLYYNALKLDPSKPYTKNVQGAWLVRITSAGISQRAKYSSLVTGTRTTCGKMPCGAQRPGINVAPAISNDGQTIYAVSRAHFVGGYGFIAAVNAAGLSPKWQTPLTGLDGKNDEGFVTDQASSTPTVAPDDSIFFGSLGNDGGRGYLNKFDSTGKYQVSYDFGWDSTPAIYVHDGTYSVIIKDNNYASGGPYYITQLSSSLQVEWQFQNTTIDKDHPDGYEWCINAPAVDQNGTVYANSEDGNVYVISQGGTQQSKLFLQLAIGAAYTPLALGLDGKIYTENDGSMFVVGN